MQLCCQDSTNPFEKCHKLSGNPEERAITDLGANTGAAAGAILSLVFADGHRPDLDALSQLAADETAGFAFMVSHAPAIETGWAELLAMGLTFDIAGLAPGPAGPEPAQGTLLGLLEAPQGEVVTLAVGPHLGDAAGMLPIVRVLAGIGVRLCSLPEVRSAVWRPASAWMTPTYFQKVVGKWLDGGAFPALGLTSLERDSDGSIYTRGLSLFTGQELRFAPDPRLGAADFARLGVRLIHALIDNDPLEVSHQFTGPDGEAVEVEPSADRAWLRVTVRR